METNKRDKENQQIPLWIRIAIVGSLLALTIYFIYGYHGVYKWLAELQIYLFDAYFPVVSGIFTFLITGLPFLGIMYFVRKKYVTDDAEEDEFTAHE